MTPGLAAQYVVIAIATLASLAYVVTSRFPGSVRRVRGWVALRMVGSGSPAIARIGRRIAPAARVDAGCGACDGCGPSD